MLNKFFVICFDREGLQGLSVPVSNDTDITARDFELLRRLRPAIHNLEQEIKRISATGGTLGPSDSKELQTVSSAG